ncbi:hypothetical protein Q6247_25890, partial [Klebsiella pneumoniae]
NIFHLLQHLHKMHSIFFQNKDKYFKNISFWIFFFSNWAAVWKETVRDGLRAWCARVVEDGAKSTDDVTRNLKHKEPIKKIWDNDTPLYMGST